MKGTDETEPITAQEGEAQEVAELFQKTSLGGPTSDPTREVPYKSCVFNSESGAKLLIHDAKRGSIGGVRVLLDGGADPNYVHPDGNTALSVAVSMGRIDIAEVLLNAGASVDGPRIDHHNGDAPAPLLSAVHGKDLNMVKLLLEAGANVNAKNLNGSTVVWYAALHGLVDILKALLAAGADQESIDGVSSGYHPLLDALYSWDIEGAKILINAGANVNVSNNGWTPLLGAGFCEPDEPPLDVVRLLIDRGADVNARDSGGCSALHSFARRGSTEMCFKLIAAGADVWCRGNFQGQGSLRWSLYPRIRLTGKSTGKQIHIASR